MLYALKTSDIDTVMEDVALWGFYAKTLFRGGEHEIGKECGNAKTQIDRPVRVPKSDLFSHPFPNRSSQDGVLGIHVHKHGIIIFSLTDNELIEIPNIVKEK